MPRASVPPIVNGKSKAQSSPSGSGNCHLRVTSGTDISSAFLAGYSAERKTVSITISVEETADSDE